jgi:hypothetical protein
VEKSGICPAKAKERKERRLAPKNIAELPNPWQKSKKDKVAYF